MQSERRILELSLSVHVRFSGMFNKRFYCFQAKVQVV